jgi:hypothetical protein
MSLSQNPQATKASGQESDPHYSSFLTKRQANNISTFMYLLELHTVPCHHFENNLGFDSINDMRCKAEIWIKVCTVMRGSSTQEPEETNPWLKSTAAS